jgi:CheY-like chemotaxis protein
VVGPGVSAPDDIPRGHGGRSINRATGAGSGPARRPGAGDGDAPPPPTATILVVDDDDAVRHFVAQVLANAGYSVVEAAGGREAVRTVFESASGPDLLLTDIQMPDLDGEQLATVVRESRPECAVIFMSGDAGNLWRVGHASRPGPLLLAKPFGRPELLETVAAALKLAEGRPH